MELESCSLPKEDSTPTNNPIKHLAIKKSVPTRRSSTPKSTTLSMNDTDTLPVDERLTKDPVINEPQKNGKFDNAQPKPTEKSTPLEENTIEKGKARITTLPTLHPDTNKDSLQKGEAPRKNNLVKNVKYAVSKPVEADEITTEDDITNCVGYKATIYDTSLVVCTLNGCNKYFTKMEKFSHHRKKEHDTTDVVTDIWIFGNMNRGENTINATSKITESPTTPIVAKAPEKNVSLPVNTSLNLVKSEKTEVSLPSLPENSARTTSTGTSRNRRQKDQELLTPSPIDNSLPNKRTQDQVPIEDSKKETSGNKRRETQPQQQFSGHNNNEIRQQQPRQQRRYPIEEEQIIGLDGRIRYPPRGNRGQNANPMYGMPYDTGDPRYYNAMQIHHMNFGLSPYGELPHPPPRYDGGYGEIPYGQFYGGGNRRFLNSPPPPPQPRRSR
ncbi:9499_t:CDS:1 [Funneliformis caledonium]|uniref:9499_t:CDS:1 n=1 Tax=Funneliformis caledonium TaxID=1117310 RepID=A0A9N9EXR4_9GLOM|nr:9499_t:CDS:1 [Funneliformis caledonium]